MYDDQCQHSLLFLIWRKFTLLDFLPSNPQQLPSVRSDHSLWLHIYNLRCALSLCALLPLIVLSSMCSIPVYRNVLWSYVCFNTFQGFLFSRWTRYEFLSFSYVIKHQRPASTHYMSSGCHLIFLSGPVH